MIQPHTCASLSFHSRLCACVHARAMRAFAMRSCKTFSVLVAFALRVRAHQAASNIVLEVKMLCKWLLCVCCAMHIPIQPSSSSSSSASRPSTDAVPTCSISNEPCLQQLSAALRVHYASIALCAVYSCAHVHACTFARARAHSRPAKFE
jgi:hypothetical protein